MHEKSNHTRVTRLTQEKYSPEEAAERIRANPAAYGTSAVLLDRQFMERLGNEGCVLAYISWVDAPDSEGWWKIDRSKRIISRIPSTEDISAINWDDKFYAYWTVTQAVDNKEPLILFVNQNSKSISISGTYISDFRARIVQAANGEPVVTKSKTLLRNGTNTA